MKIEITNGYVNIKETYPRKISKQVNKILFKNVELTNEGIDGEQKSITSGFNMSATEEANDYVLLHMINKIVLIHEGKETEEKVVIDVIDEFDTKDYQKIKNAIDKIANPTEEVKKN